MKAGQTLYTANNVQVMLFPLPSIYISQGENGQYSHRGTLNIDFLGWNNRGRVYNQEYYAPCDCTCVMKSTSAYYNVWNSTNQVYCADQVTRYVCWQNIHGNYLLNVGATYPEDDNSYSNENNAKTIIGNTLIECNAGYYLNENECKENDFY